jgi:hypothetical protein
VVEPTISKSIPKEVYEEYLENLLPKKIPMLSPMNRWVKDSKTMSDEDEANIGVQIRINKKRTKTKKGENGKLIKYNDTAQREYDYDRIFGAVALALLSACPGISIRGIRENTKEITKISELTELEFVREDYLESPVETSKGVFFTRIHIRSNPHCF